MNGLSSRYSEQIDFFHFDFDQAATGDVLQALNVRRRSTYILFAPDGTELFRWIGPLSSAEVIAEIEAQLEAFSN